VITIDELIVADDAGAWSAAGFTVEEDHARIGTVRVRLAGRAEAGDRGERGEGGVVAWVLRGARLDGADRATAAAIDALPTQAAASALTRPPGDAASHANGTTAIDHIVVATPDLARSISAFEDAGFELRRERDAGTIRQAFFRAGEVIVEVVGPRDSAKADPAPARFFGLAINVVDLDATKRFFGDRLTDPKPAVQQGRRIATLRHRDVGISTAIAFMSV
jgi:hypothetical protein